mmetsp:Transcript_17281/g.65870  ORF Transcript_17281/g.65870 Transcript_17281/m.65870 type:complete len:346 (-) Transcript_17281:556-1593(-)
MGGNRKQREGRNGAGRRDGRDADTGVCRISATIQPGKGSDLAGVRVLPRSYGRPVRAAIPPVVECMRLRRANHADFRVFPRVWNDLLDGPPEALGALVLELLVLRALGVQALPDRPRLIPGRVCVDDVLASRGQSRIKLGRHAHDNHIARDIDAVLVPSIHDRPLRRSVVGHELLIDPNVHVHEALALLDVPSPELVRLLVESLVSASRNKLGCRPDVGVAHNCFPCTDRQLAICSGFHPNGPPILDQNLFHWGRQLERATVLRNPPSERVHNSTRSANGKVQRPRSPVEVVDHVRHHRGEGAFRIHALEQKAQQIHPVSQKVVRDIHFVHQLGEGLRKTPSTTS